MGYFTEHQHRIVKVSIINIVEKINELIRKIFHSCFIQFSIFSQFESSKYLTLILNFAISRSYKYFFSLSHPTQPTFCHCAYLKYGFCKKSLRKDENLTSWTLFWAYLSSLSEVTSYKIYTLVLDFPWISHLQKSKISRHFFKGIMYVFGFGGEDFGRKEFGM